MAPTVPLALSTGGAASGPSLNLDATVHIGNLKRHGACTGALVGAIMRSPYGTLSPSLTRTAEVSIISTAAHLLLWLSSTCLGTRDSEREKAAHKSAVTEGLYPRLLHKKPRQKFHGSVRSRRSSFGLGFCGSVWMYKREIAVPRESLAKTSPLRGFFHVIPMQGY